MKPLAQLKNDAGQSVVLFVLIMSGLFAIMAFLVNVGALFVSGHRLQGVADSASLAAAQDYLSVQAGGVGAIPRPDLFAGDDAVYGPHGYLKSHAPNVVRGTICGGYCVDVRDVSGSDKPTSEVNVAANVPVYLGDVFDLIGLNLSSVTLHASSVASTQPTTAIDRIAPLALECDDACQTDAQKARNFWHWPLDGSSSYCFRWAPLSGSEGVHPVPGGGCDPHGSALDVPHFLPMDLPGSSLDNLSCAPQISPTNCNPTVVDLVPDATQPRDPDGLDDFRQRLTDASGPDVRIVPVYRAPSYPDLNPNHEVLGWAAVSWSVRPRDADPSDPNYNANRFEIDVSFHKLFVDSSHLTGAGIPAAGYDFGVEAVGLTGCASTPDGCGG